MVVAMVGIVSTPLLWLLDGPDTSQVAAACVQAAVAIVSLAWALVQHPSPAQGPVDVAASTGKAEASGGGSAGTGVRRHGGEASGSATAERTGDARADGAGSQASTGVEYT
ncbi:hypothetical protein [Streptomyces sp. NPDC086023]|uniref:hypothetical protein n=1 Tax=Streptomyces sp. NPDC086023 TaxID=3365746 RepID=UPI0037D64C0A